MVVHNAPSPMLVLTTLTIIAPQNIVLVAHPKKAPPVGAAIGPRTCRVLVMIRCGLLPKQLGIRPLAHILNTAMSALVQ